MISSHGRAETTMKLCVKEVLHTKQHPQHQPSKHILDTSQFSTFGIKLNYKPIRSSIQGKANNLMCDSLYLLGKKKPTFFAFAIWKPAWCDGDQKRNF